MRQTTKNNHGSTFCRTYIVPLCSWNPNIMSQCYLIPVFHPRTNKHHEHETGAAAVDEAETSFIYIGRADPLAAKVAGTAVVRRAATFA